MAYVLGFFFADGSHDINPRGSEYFSFQIADKKLLYQIRTCLQSNHKVAVRLPRKPFESTQYRLQIGSKSMCEDLRSHGVHVQKANTMEFPMIPQIFFPHFVRGYFDGDGNVWSGRMHKKRKTQYVALLTAFTSGSKNFLDHLHSQLSNWGLKGGAVYCKKRAFCIKYSTSDSLKLYDIMYSSCEEDDILLERKRIVFERYISRKHRLSQNQ